MQTIGFNLNTFGYVRVQVASQPHYGAARELLAGIIGRLTAACHFPFR